MTLDKISIGARIRKIREEIYHETRQNFAERCGLTENHLGRIERGDYLINLESLNKICSSSGTNPNYILYGKSESNNLNIRKTIDNFLDDSTKQELKVYFKFISTFKSFIETNNKSM